MRKNRADMFLKIIDSFLILSLIFFAGCGRKNTNKKVTIVFSNWETLPEQIVANQKVIRAFTEKFPDIKVEYQTPRQIDKILIQIAGGAPPDVFFWPSDRLAPLVEKKAIQNLDLFTETDKDFKIRDYFDVSFELCRYDGKVYGIPVHLDVNVVYYNKSLFDELKLSYPEPGWTWDDLVAIAQKLTRDINGDGRIDQFGFYLGWEPILAQLAQKNVEFFSEDGTESTFNTPQAVDVLMFCTDLVAKYQVCPARGSSQGALGEMNAIQAFMMGRLGMFIGGSCSMIEFSRAKNLNWDIVTIPEFKEKTFPVRIGGVMLVISPATKHPREVWEFIKFYCGESGSKIFAGLKNSVPAFKNIAYSSVFLNPPPEHINYFIKQVEESRPISNYPRMNEFMQVIFGPEIEKMILGIQGPSLTVKGITDKTNELLKEN